MRGGKLGGALAGIMLLMSGAHAGEPIAQGAGAGAWSERVQILYRAETRSVVRRTVRVWNPEPHKNLDFVWEPSAGQPGDGVAANGAIEGSGRLVWRVRGSASYDPRTVYSTYTGELRDGRPHGRGRLEIRSGEVIDGDWSNGEPSGRAIWIDAAGNRYEGEFLRGKPNGGGRYLSATGEIFDGRFVDGVRHGEGTTRLAGGTVYRSTWHRGREIGANRPDVMADALVGGLLRAQAGGGDAGKVEIAVTVEERMNQQAAMQYQHLVRDEDIAIYPLSEEMNNFWNGNMPIPPGSYTIDGVDWTSAPAFVEVELSTTDGSRAKLDKLELQVASSEVYRKPMLTLNQHFGCVGFRPTFSLVNHGWGEVRDASVSIQFSADDEGPASRVFAEKIENFDDGADISIRGILDQAGVDTAKLETKRYSCQSMDSINVCRSQVFNDVGFGEIADYVSGEDKLSTLVKGTLNYSWADDGGNVYQQSEPFVTSISLAVIEVPQELAECGDGFGGSPEALRYQDVTLPLGKSGYSIPMPLRGNRSISSYTARLKMHAEPDQSSFHRFKVAAGFADGSTRESKTISLFYFHPRMTTFQSTATPGQCYLNEALGGC